MKQSLFYVGRIEDGLSKDSKKSLIIYDDDEHGPE